MMSHTTKPDILQPTAEMAVDLFDNWFDPIETRGARSGAREFGADYSDMIYAATREDTKTRRKAFIRKWRLKTPRCRRQPGRGRRPAL